MRRGHCCKGLGLRRVPDGNLWAHDLVFTQVKSNYVGLCQPSTRDLRCSQCEHDISMDGSENEYYLCLGSFCSRRPIHFFCKAPGQSGSISNVEEVDVVVERGRCREGSFTARIEGLSLIPETDLAQRSFTMRLPLQLLVDADISFDLDTYHTKNFKESKWHVVLGNASDNMPPGPCIVVEDSKRADGIVRADIEGEDGKRQYWESNRHDVVGPEIVAVPQPSFPTPAFPLWSGREYIQEVDWRAVEAQRRYDRSAYLTQLMF